MLPLVAGLLIALGMQVLSGPQRPRGLYLWLVSGTAVLVSVAGLVGAAMGLV
jgi:hypothetical protein